MAVQHDPLQVLSAFLTRHPAPSILIAYSGGMDSHVLLHACATLRPQFPALGLQAMHIDHGLQAGSAAWAQHCAATCAALAVDFSSMRLALEPRTGISLEAQAREARYQALAAVLPPDAMLLTAHHQRDQAETVLLNLLRGAGVDGLAAMPTVRPFGPGRLGRPLLALPHAALLAYAHRKGLHWVEDPSNASETPDRNFLRHTVLPLLAGRWPGVEQTLARAAGLQAESRAVLEILLPEKLAQVAGSRPRTLSIKRLQLLEPALQSALLRQWFRELALPLPGRERLLQIPATVLSARADALPRVAWPGGEVRRFRDDLYALPPLPPHDPACVLPWLQPDQPLWLAGSGTWLEPLPLAWRESLAGDGVVLTVRFWQPGQPVRHPGGRRVAMKKHFQQAGILPWERSRIALVYADACLIRIAGVRDFIDRPAGAPDSG